MNTEPDKALALDVQGVTKRFFAAGREIKALQDVSLNVRHGNVTGLIGPDGAGKTTLMRLTAGLLLPDAGNLHVLGMDTGSKALAVQADLGYMPQRFGLYEDLSVQENLDLYADLQGLPARNRPERFRELLHMTGLGPFTRRLAGRLSGGMKQKLGLACTLVRAPRLLLLDEPTVGVDPVSRRELWSIVYRLVEQEGMSVILSTAYLDEAERCADVILLHEGRVLDQGSPRELSARVLGRSYSLAAPGRRSRDLQAVLADRPGVIDAVVQGDHVRLVMAEPAAPDLNTLLPGVSRLSLTPVAPRFEDEFVSLLHRRHPPAQTPVEIISLSENAPAEEETVIKVHALKRRFGDFYAVDGISFEVCRGEIFGLLGANGAGKSTTFRMLCGLLPASEGTLRVAGVDLRYAAAAARARIGYMSQRFSLYGNLSVRQNLEFFAGAYGLKGVRRNDRIRWALAEFELTASADQTSADLPLGYKQRLAMACALMHEPDILFLDEPTSGVDPLARREFWRRINTLAVSGVTIMVTTHFMEEAEYCDRLGIMAAGRLLAIGQPSEIKSRVREGTAAEPNMEEAFIRLTQLAAAGAAA